MEFQWDAEKASRNFEKHGVLFKPAANVFLDPAHADAEDGRRSYGEERRVVFGKIDWRVFCHRLYVARQHDPFDFGAEGK